MEKIINSENEKILNQIFMKNSNVFEGKLL